MNWLGQKTFCTTVSGAYALEWKFNFWQRGLHDFQAVFTSNFHIQNIRSILFVISSGEVGQAIWAIPSCWGHICWVDEPDMEIFQPRTDLSKKQDHLLIQY